MKGPPRAAMATARVQGKHAEAGQRGQAAQACPGAWPRGSCLAPHTGQAAPPAGKRPPMSHRQGPTCSGNPLLSPCSWSQRRPPGSRRHSAHGTAQPVSAQHAVSAWPAPGPAARRSAPANPGQAASAWPSPAARRRSHPPRACTPAPRLCRALFPDIYLAGPLAEARSLLKRHLPAASLCLPTCKRSMASTPGP